MCQFTVSCCLLGLGMTAPGEIWWSLLHFLETPHFGKALELWETSAQKHDRERKKPWDRTAPMELGARKAGSTADCTPGRAGAPDKMLSLQGGSENSTLISPALISVLPSFVSSAGSGPEWGLSSGQWGIYDSGVSDFIRACPSSLTRSLLCCWVSWICGWTSSSEVHHPRAFLVTCVYQLWRNHQSSSDKHLSKKLLKANALLFLVAIQAI